MSACLASTPWFPCRISPALLECVEGADSLAGCGAFPAHLQGLGVVRRRLRPAQACRGTSEPASNLGGNEVAPMNGFVKLRRGLAEHVRSGRMNLSEHGAFTLLLQLSDYSTGRWHGTQRSFALAAGISSGSAWKLLTSLERKGYLRWNRACGFVEIPKFSVENARQKPVQNSVETPTVHGCHGQPVNRIGRSADQLKRNIRNPWKRRSAVNVSSEGRVLPSGCSERPDCEEIPLRNQIALSIHDLAQRKSVSRAFHPPLPTRVRSGPAVLPFFPRRNPP